ncbi:MAG: ABC transporter permease [Candidatus Methanomethylophilaceae archaeon]
MYRTFAYIERDLIRWSRSSLNIISTLAMPAAWLIFVGLVMPVRYDNYLDFVTPGVLVLTMMTAGLAAGSSIMFDKTLGYLNKFLALPAPRESILVGKILFITLRGLLQTTVILVIATLIGATVQSLMCYVEMYLVLFLFGVMMSSLGSTVALYLNDHDTYAAFQGMVSMPLYFASTALIPYDQMPEALKIISTLNPLTYAIDAMRDLAAGNFPLIQICVLLTLSVAIVLICARRFRKVTVQ